MKTVLRLLKKELKEWRSSHTLSKRFFKGLEKTKDAQATFKNELKHINELNLAIAVLSEID